VKSEVVMKIIISGYNAMQSERYFTGVLEEPAPFIFRMEHEAYSSTLKMEAGCSCEETGKDVLTYTGSHFIRE
jgi:hypothetical protein